jgi:hypothetical protein
MENSKRFRYYHTTDVSKIPVWFNWNGQSVGRSITTINSYDGYNPHTWVGCVIRVSKNRVLFITPKNEVAEEAGMGRTINALYYAGVSFAEQDTKIVSPETIEKLKKSFIFGKTGYSIKNAIENSLDTEAGIHAKERIVTHKRMIEASYKALSDRRRARKEAAMAKAK